MSYYIDGGLDLGVFALIALADEAGVLTLTLESGDHPIRIVFEDYLAYRKMDEGDAARTLARISETAGLGKGLYRVENSDFVAWYQLESSEVRKPSVLLHFVVMTVDDVIDVIALSPPKARIGRP